MGEADQRQEQEHDADGEHDLVGDPCVGAKAGEGKRGADDQVEDVPHVGQVQGHRPDVAAGLVVDQGPGVAGEQAAEADHQEEDRPELRIETCHRASDVSGWRGEPASRDHGHVVGPPGRQSRVACPGQRDAERIRRGDDRSERRVGERLPEAVRAQQEDIPGFASTSKMSASTGSPMTARSMRLRFWMVPRLGGTQGSEAHLAGGPGVVVGESAVHRSAADQIGAAVADVGDRRVQRRR